MKINIETNVSAYKEEVDQQMKVLLEISKRFEPFKRLDFNLNTCTELNLDSLNILHSVYIIKINNFGMANKGADFCDIIKKIKDRNSTKYKLPQINFTNSDSDILYIGKSTGSLKTRLDQHFKGKISKTYALHLSRWQNEKKLNGMEMSLFYTSIDFEHCGITVRQEQKDLLELIETSLHRKYQPLLGRTGH